MTILGHRSEALQEIARDRATYIEELDLVTGQFIPVYGNLLPQGPASHEIRLTPLMICGRVWPTEEFSDDASFLTYALSLLYQRNWTSLLLDSALRPMDFEVQSDEYYSEIAQRTLIAMQGRYVIVRLFDDKDDGKKLRCIAVEDQRGLLSSKLDIYDLDDHSPSRDVYRAAEQRFLDEEAYLTVLTRDKYTDIFDKMTQAGTQDITSIIVSPLTIGMEIKGFINIGYDTQIDLNEYLKLTFATVFNNICIAIENFQKLNEISNLRNLKVRDFIEHLHVDLIQGFRHSAHTALMEAHIAHQKMLSHYQYKGDQKLNPSNTLQARIETAEVALESMASLRSYAEGKIEASIVNAFDDAADLLSTQILDNDISVRKDIGGQEELTAFVNYDAVRSAFANLLLNSIQAIKDAKTKKTDRKIVVSFRKDKGTIFIDFSDSGPGIRVPSGDIQRYSDIWVAGKTSKKTGTGYGLPMVREVFEGLHTGSIDLRESSRGAHFRITLRDGLTEDR